jgi:hypothetical protein
LTEAEIMGPRSTTLTPATLSPSKSPGSSKASPRTFATENFRVHVERVGYIPDSFLQDNPQAVTEAVAMRLTTEAIQEAIASG